MRPAPPKMSCVPAAVVLHPPGYDAAATEAAVSVPPMILRFRALQLLLPKSS
jgi:hypothetical protein